jgi:hypothetical protein
MSLRIRFCRSGASSTETSLPSERSAKLLPLLTEITSMKVLMSTPSSWAIPSTSSAFFMLVMVSALLSSLVSCPLPGPPSRWTVVEKVAKTGRQVSYAASSPPTKGGQGAGPVRLGLRRSPARRGDASTCCADREQRGHVRLAGRLVGLWDDIGAARTR